MNWIKVVIIIVKDKQGNFFVHQRNSKKKTSPNLYGLGAGGHVEKDESSIIAAKRELFEETELTSNIEHLFHVNYKNKELKHSIDVFETEINQMKIRMDNEWQWRGWMEKEEVDNLVKENKLCPDTEKVYKKYQELVTN